MGAKLDELKSHAREDLVERMNGEWPGRNNAHDMVHECADGMVPVYTAEIMALAAESEVYNFKGELGPGRDGSATLENIAVGAIYEILCNYLYGELDEIKEELEAAEEDDAREEE